MKGIALQALGGIVITFIVIAMIITFRLEIMSNVREDQTSTVTETETELGVTVNTAATLALNQARIVTNSENVSANTSDMQTWTFTRVIDYNVSYDNLSGVSTLDWFNSTFDNRPANISYNWRYDAYDYDYNASNYGMQSLDTIASWLPTLALVIIASIILGVVIMYLGRKPTEA